MTTIEKFLQSKDSDTFIDVESGEEFTREQIDLGFQSLSCEPHVTILEYYSELVTYLKRFRKVIIRQKTGVMVE